MGTYKEVAVGSTMEPNFPTTFIISVTNIYVVGFAALSAGSKAVRIQPLDSEWCWSKYGGVIL